MRRIPLIIFFLSLFLCAGTPQAEVPRPKLELHMGYADVLTRWGPPVEKREFESKREDLWLYGEEKVIFRNGKVIAWSDAPSSPSKRMAAQAEKKLRLDKSSKGRDLEDSKKEQAVEEILEDLMQGG